jgi:hypothetical protein
MRSKQAACQPNHWTTRGASVGGSVPSFLSEMIAQVDLQLLVEAAAGDQLVVVKDRRRWPRPCGPTVAWCGHSTASYPST